MNLIRARLGHDLEHGARVSTVRSEEHTSELQSQSNLVCRLLLEKKKKKKSNTDLEVLPDVDTGAAKTPYHHRYATVRGGVVAYCAVRHYDVGARTHKDPTNRIWY